MGDRLLEGPQVPDIAHGKTKYVALHVDTHNISQKTGQTCSLVGKRTEVNKTHRVTRNTKTAQSSRPPGRSQKGQGHRDQHQSQGITAWKPVPRACLSMSPVGDRV